MALTKGVNSYVSVEDAEAYFLNRIDVSAWNEAEATEKERALITATTMMEYMSWVGTMADENQKLVFPRIGYYFDTRTKRNTNLASVPLPLRVIQGQCELAHHLLENDGLLDSSGTIAELQVGPITIKGSNNASRIPSFIRNILGPLLSGSVESSRVGGAWWRAN